MNLHAINTAKAKNFVKPFSDGNHVFDLANMSIWVICILLRMLWLNPNLRINYIEEKVKPTTNESQIQCGWSQWWSLCKMKNKSIKCFHNTPVVPSKYHQAVTFKFNSKRCNLCTSMQYCFATQSHVAFSFSCDQHVINMIGKTQQRGTCMKLSWVLTHDHEYPWTWMWHQITDIFGYLG